MCRLQLNDTKTVLMAIPRKKSKTIRLSLNIKNETILSSSQLKILCWIFNFELTSVADLNHTLQICYSNLQKILSVKKLLSPETKATFVKAYVISRLNYMSFSYIPLNYI